ncbi:MAG: pilus assembly protein PilP [Pseudomonadota bacterium]
MNSDQLGRLAVAIALVSVLAGCSGGTAELKKELDERRKRQGSYIEPLPQIKTYESFQYDPAGLRSPFQPSVSVAASGSAGPRPDSHRSREFLENYPLDSLKLVGTLRQGGRTYGLIQTKDGLVHRILPGNHVGQNEGRVTAITDARINVVELVSDGAGGYVERPASILLAGN